MSVEMSPKKRKAGVPERKTIFEFDDQDRFIVHESNLGEVLKDLKSVFRQRCNGWAALALIYGSDKVTEKLNSSAGTISIVCGLFLSATVPLVINPGDSIGTLDNTDFRKYLYLLFMCISIIFHVSSIFNSCLLVMLLNASGREADKLRVFQKLDKLPTLSFTMFCIGNFGLILGGGFAISVVYGVNAQIVWCCVTSIFCGFLFLFMNAKFFMPIGHISHGWYNKDKADFIEKIDRVIDKLEESMITNNNNYEENLKAKTK